MTTPIFNQVVLDYQKMLPGLGVAYSGPQDGVINPELISAVKKLEQIIQVNTGKDAIGKIYNGSLVMPISTVYKTYFPGKLLKIPESKEAPKIELSHNLQIKAFQEFLSKQGFYSGPIDGVANSELDSAAKKIEAAISDALNGKSMSGIIWNSSQKQFNTTVEDVQKALQLIKDHKEKIAKSTVDQRFLLMSYWLTKKS